VDSRSCFLVVGSKGSRFFILIELTWLFLEHVHKVNDEMLVRGKCCRGFVCVSCLYRFVLFRCVFNSQPVSEGQ
jgi:hypothetical protein